MTAVATHWPTRCLDNAKSSADGLQCDSKDRAALADGLHCDLLSRPPQYPELSLNSDNETDWSCEMVEQSEQSTYLISGRNCMPTLKSLIGGTNPTK